jgi:hypothetical protein
MERIIRDDAYLSSDTVTALQKDKSSFYYDHKQLYKWGCFPCPTDNRRGNEPYK